MLIFQVFDQRRRISVPLNLQIEEKKKEGQGLSEKGLSAEERLAIASSFQKNISGKIFIKYRGHETLQELDEWMKRMKDNGWKIKLEYTGNGYDFSYSAPGGKETEFVYQPQKKPEVYVQELPAETEYSQQPKKNPEVHRSDGSNSFSNRSAIPPFMPPNNGRIANNAGPKYAAPRPSGPSHYKPKIPAYATAHQPKLRKGISEGTKSLTFAGMQISLKVYSKWPQKGGAVLVNIHPLEKTSIEAGLDVIEKNGGILICADYAGGRMDDVTEAKFLKKIFAGFIQKFSLSRVIALHNNFFQTVDTYKGDGQVFKNMGENPHNYFFCTQPEDAAALNRQGYSVVLQDNNRALEKGLGLSSIMGAKRISYICIEAQHDFPGSRENEEKQVQMIEDALRLRLPSHYSVATYEEKENKRRKRA